jgi:hypothetical protein
MPPSPSKTHLAALKSILENLDNPDSLDDHPWVDSLPVREAVQRDASLAGQSSGRQLVQALGDLFRALQPATPPHKGKRLDTRWGRFGILAARYFAPLLYTGVYPPSLRDAWRRIDSSILLFVYGQPAAALTPQQVAAYHLVGDDVDLAANSTISDWHRRGLEDLAALFINHENNLCKAPGLPWRKLPGKEPARRQPGQAHTQAPWLRFLLWAAALALLIALLLAGFKGRRIYNQYQAVNADALQLQQLHLGSLDPQDLQRAGPILSVLHQDVLRLQAEAAPGLELGRSLGWVPVYGGDLRYAGDILEVAAGFSASADNAYQAVFPLWQILQQPGQAVKLTEITDLLLKTQPALQQSREMLQSALRVRSQIPAQALSPRLQALLAQVDLSLPILDEGLALAVKLPAVLGAAPEGPKTYLILIQNEDDLRATGGFISAVGKVVVWKGQLVSFNSQNVENVDDLSQPYPVAPWQLQRYMYLPIMTFRDTSWFVDYPTAVLWAEYLYAYKNHYSVDGVFAIDQYVLESLLAVLGPVQVPEMGQVLTAENVRQAMRQARLPTPAEKLDPNWNRKDFMNSISSAILARLLTGQGVDWEKILAAMLIELNQRHILVQMDDARLTSFLAERGWDGAVRYPDTGGDFLMAVDTNVGYGKVNSLISQRLNYEIDLSDPGAPTSHLQLIHQNAAQGTEVCNQATIIPDGPDLATRMYGINFCYYNYLRIYRPAGTGLVGATPHSVPGVWMKSGQSVPAGVDALNEHLKGLDGFGTLMVVPKGESLETDFDFTLPATLVQAGPEPGTRLYRLKIQKQPGALAAPVTVRVTLPAGAIISATSPPGKAEGGKIVFELTLEQDIEISITYRP